jgi:hypothetical protein
MCTALPAVCGPPILTYWLPIPIPLPSHLPFIEQIHSLLSFDGCAGCILTIPLFVDCFVAVCRDGDRLERIGRKYEESAGLGA